MCGVIIMESAAGILILIKKLITSSFCWIQTNKFQSCLMNIFIFCFVFCSKSILSQCYPSKLQFKTEAHWPSLLSSKHLRRRISPHWLDSKMCGGENMTLLIASVHYNNKLPIYSQAVWTCTEWFEVCLDDTISLSQPIFHVIIHWSDKTINRTIKESAFLCLLSRLQQVYILFNPIIFPYDGALRCDSLNIVN